MNRVELCIIVELLGKCCFAATYVLVEVFITLFIKVFVALDTNGSSALLCERSPYPVSRWKTRVAA